MHTITRRSFASFGVMLLLLLALAGCGDNETEYTQTLNFKAPISLSGKFEGEAGQPSPQPQEIEVFIAAPFDLAAESPDLQDRADKGLFTNLRLVSFTYTLENNTLSQDLKNIELALGPEGSEDPNASETVLLGLIEEIKAGDSAGGEGTLETANLAALSQHLFNLQFSMMQGVKIRLEAGDIIPSGSVTIKSTITVVMTSDDP